jgi:hypothetical protein
MPVCGLVGGYPLFSAACDEPNAMALQSHFASLGIRYAEKPAAPKRHDIRHDIEKGHSMSTVEQAVLRQTSDEDLAKQYLDFVHSGKRGSSTYLRVEAEMRARNLIRQSRLDTNYTASRSSFSPRTSMFSSF